MQPFVNKKPMPGLDVINPDVPEARFMMNKNYILIELYAKFEEGEQYCCFYLRPYKGTQTLITGFVPEMEYLENLRVFNKVELIKFLSRSEFFSNVYKNKTIQENKPFIRRIDDFTGDHNKVMCVQNIINAELTPRLINVNDPEYQKLRKGTNEIIDVANEFLKINDEHVQDLSIASWVNNLDKKLLLHVINKYKESNLFDYFINHIDNIKKEAKELVVNKRVLILGKNYIYGMDCSKIDEDDKSEEAELLILAEIFDQSLKDSGIFLRVELDGQGWHPQIRLGQVITNISKMLNNVHKEAWAKFDKSMLKAMPKVTDFWFYSNPYHYDVFINDFIKYGDKTDQGLDRETDFSIEEPDHIRDSYWTLDFSNVWRDYGSLNPVTYLINNALTILFEYYRYYPIWKKKKYLKIATHGIRLLLNPFRYGATELIKKKKSEE